ncbi:hypothetical protein WI25_01340 [Burkholderia cepacia]|uniref:hypothetical protein n=1 Tax=Burkholderia cepacia TaxID=292 RepID=UPI00075CA005|nr:hypothetical protein [Burkholderia cepacia]KUY74547.1 hypothetical protein WI25_01340 [Burkholderia cepacia]
MKEPILSREEVEALWSELHEEHHWLDVPQKFYERLESALLEKLYGEPIYQIAFSDEDGWCDTHKKCYDDHPEHMRRIVYALNRSKA